MVWFRPPSLSSYAVSGTDLAYRATATRFGTAPTKVRSCPIALCAVWLVRCVPTRSVLPVLVLACGVVLHAPTYLVRMYNATRIYVAMPVLVFRYHTKRICLTKLVLTCQYAATRLVRDLRAWFVWRDRSGVAGT
eukprot:790515-Rhodomonas_salina.5